VGFKTLFSTGSIIRFSIPTITTILIIFFCPQWLLLTLCLILAYLYKKWYGGWGGFIAIPILIIWGLIFPLFAQWTYEIANLRIFYDVYNLVKFSTPRPPSIPLISFNMDTLTFTPNVDPTLIAFFFTFMVAFSLVIIKFGKTKYAITLMASGTALFYGVMCGISVLCTLPYAFTMGQIDVTAIIFQWNEVILLYHVFINMLPIAVVYIGLTALIKKLGGYV